MQVSDLINCGVYIFTPDIFAAIEDVSINREGRGLFLSTRILQASIILLLILFSIHDKLEPFKIDLFLLTAPQLTYDVFPALKLSNLRQG